MTVHLINQLTTPVVLIFFALGFFTIWFQFRNFKSAQLFALSYLMAAFAFIGEIILGANADPTFIRLAVDNLYLLSVMTSVAAIAIRYGKPIPLKSLFVMQTIASAVITYFYIVDIGVIAKAYIISSICSFMMALALPLMRDSRKRLIDKVLYYAVAFSALQLMLNAAIIVVIDKGFILENSDYKQGFISLLNFSVIIISLTIALCLLISYGFEIIMGFKDKSETDGMTGLKNRSAFEGMANHQIALAKENKVPLSLVVADIDFFKKVNDTYGHITGDEVIKSFGEVLLKSIRVIDVVGRIGGEEFCILLATANENMAKLIAENARVSFEQGRHIQSDSDKVLTASFGIAQYIDGESYEALFERADNALYASKQNGRNKVTIFSDKTKLNEALLSA